MIRTLACASLALLLCAGIGLAADKEKVKAKSKSKNAKAVHGKVQKVDTAKAAVTVTVKTKQETTQKDIAVTDATRVVTFQGDDRSEVTGKAGLQKIKQGDRVNIVLDKDGAAREITVNPQRKKKSME